MHERGLTGFFARRGACSASVSMTWLRRSLVAAVGAVVTVSLAMPALSSDSSEFACEEAVAHLVSCCDGLPPTRFDCFLEPGCGSEMAPTVDFDVHASGCIKAMSCQRIQERGLCEQLADDPESLSCE